MANEETKAVDEFLGDVREDDKPDALLEVNTEVKEEEEPDEVIEDKPLPFHKDPKVLRFIEKEVERRLPREKEQPVEEPTTDDIDEVLTRIIGNDTPEKISAIKDFKKILLEREDRGAEKAYQRMQAEAEEERQAEAEADEELVTGFENIEETFGVDITSDQPQARKLRGEFINFIRKVAPKNEEGEVIEFPDLEQTFDAFQSTRAKTSNNRAKDLASRGTERGSNSPAPVTQEDKSWSAVDRIFDKLTGK